MADPYLRENIEIPENFNLEMAFKGKLEEFEITANVTGSFGAANLIASIDRVKILVKINFGSPAWRNDDLVLNVVIEYPF